MRIVGAQALLWLAGSATICSASGLLLSLPAVAGGVDQGECGQDMLASLHNKVFCAIWPSMALTLGPGWLHGNHVLRLHHVLGDTMFVGQHVVWLRHAMH
jgi:hypothetical protein